MATITNILPAYDADLAADRETARWTPITFDVDAVTGVPFVFCTLGPDPYWTLVIYDGAAFQPLFSDHSTVEEDSGVFSFSILPTGGWWDAPTIEVGQFAAASEV